MKKRYLLLLLFTASVMQAQYTIKGTMSPIGKDNWIILYKVEGTQLIFVKNTTIKTAVITVDTKKETVGKFKFVLPADAKTGAYRISYKLKGSGFLDFSFNKENIAFTFNPAFPEASLVYTQSKENKLYHQYLQASSIAQQKIDLLQNKYFQKPSESIKIAYQEAVKKADRVAKKYSNLSKGMLVHHLIVASHQFNSPAVIGDMQQYLNSTMSHFFDTVDFKNPALYNSSFLIDKITDYIFFLTYSNEKKQQQKYYRSSIGRVMQKITAVKFKKEIIEFLIKRFVQRKDVELVDTLFSAYYSKLPKHLQDKKFKDSTLSEVAAEIGRIAPDFSWKENKKMYRLSTLKEAKQYLLVFWSSTCSHCLKEIPLVYSYMKSHPKTKVIAFGLEKDKHGWQHYIPKLQGWHHILGLHKWENPIAHKYQILATPSYFVLNADKKIVAKPYDLKEIKAYYNKK